MPRSASQKPLALPRRGQQSRVSGTTVPVTAVYRHRLAKPQQPYPSHVSSRTKQLRHGRAGDCCIPTSISEATGNSPRRRSSYNSNQRCNSQYGSNAINRCILTATMINDHQRRLARQQRQHIRVGNSCMLAATRKSKALLAHLYINSDQESGTISGTTVPLMVAYSHSRVSATTLTPTLTLSVPTHSDRTSKKGGHCHSMSAQHTMFHAPRVSGSSFRWSSTLKSPPLELAARVISCG